MLKWPWAGRVDARRGVAALALVMGGLVTGAGLLGGGCTGVTGQAILSAGYAASLVAQDRNGDGMLDRSEVTAMVEAALPPEAQAGPGWSALRAWLVAGYMAQDGDRDGRLSLAELLSGPRAAIDCADVNGDRALSESEVAASMGRCPAGILPVRGEPDFTAIDRIG